MKPGVPVLPWPTMGAVLCAAGALAFVPSGFPVTAVLTLAVLLQRWIPVRLPERRWLTWSVRVVAMGGIGWLHLGDEAATPILPVEALVGQLALAELTLQAWRARPSGGARGEAVVVLSALVFVAACYNREPLPARMAAPNYFLSVILGLRALRTREAHATRASLRPFAIAGLVALGIGTLVAETAWYYRDTLYRWVAAFDRWVTQRESGGGFSTAPRLGAGPGWNSSHVRMLRIVGDLPSPHLRGLAFVEYSEGAWGPSLQQRLYVPLTADRSGQDAPGPRCRVERLRAELNTVFHPLECSGVRPDPTPLGEVTEAASGLHMHPEVGYELIAGGPLPWEGAPNPALRERCLGVPASLDARVRELAEAATAGQADARGKVAAVTRWLLTHHSYSLATTVGPGDPVTSFLLERKAAHCEYFASASAILLRCVGVPTRYVSGFFAHEQIRPGVLVVRQQDAHAWAEAWIDGTGWVTVEATPGDGQPAATSTPPDWRQRLEETLDDLTERVKAWLAHADWATLAALAGAAGALFVLARALRLRRLVRAAQASGPPYSCPDPSLAAIACRFDRLLRREGILCPPGRTWRTHLESLAEGRPARPLDALRGFVREYDAVRFGGPPAAAAITKLDERLTALTRGTRGEAT